MLQSQTLWTAIPSTLNDPFECRKTLRGLATSAENAQQQHWLTTKFLESYRLRSIVERGDGAHGLPNRGLRLLLERLNSATSLDEIKETLRVIFGSPSPLGEPTDFMVLAEQTIREVGILSLSKRPDVMLMWSHYADSHRGYCLGFERRPDNRLGDPVRTAQVSYANEVPELNLDQILIQKAFFACDSFGFPRVVTKLKLETESLRHVLFTKSPDWAYEEEWRHVVEKGNREISYPGPLREVIFGLKMEPSDRMRIIDVVSESHGKVAFRQMRIAPTGLLEVHDLDAACD